MTKKNTLFFLFISCWVYPQQNDSIPIFSNFTTAEILIGKTKSTNSGFPETNLHKTILLSFGNTHNDNTDEWTYRLRKPKTGISFALTDFGNPEYLGYSFSVIPFMEYKLLRKYIDGISMHLGMGASYFTYNYKNLPYSFNNYPENNSRAVSTKITWAFRMFFYYNIFKEKNADWKAGFGILHQSNGHTNLPNNGFNSILASLSRQSNYNHRKRLINTQDFVIREYKNSSHYFYSLRTGLGVNVLSEDINKRNGVYTVAASFGKIFNKTFKIGTGFYYRFYENYYNYIQNNGELVVEEYPYFKEKPLVYASNYGAFITSELLLGHIGVDIDISYNIYKPFYKVDWKLTQGFYWEFGSGEDEEIRYVYRDFDDTYKLKRAISTRVGLKYYLFSFEKEPKNNFYIGAFINANLAQADFTELSFGFIRTFNFKEKK